MVNVIHDDGSEATYNVEEIMVLHGDGPLLVEASVTGAIKITQSVCIDSTCKEIS